MADWGHEWLQTSPSLESLDTRFHMWDIMRNTKPLSILPNPFIVQINLTGTADAIDSYWFVFEGNKVDLFNKDNNYTIDVEITADAEKLTEIWMGCDDFDSAVKQKQMIIIGECKYT